MIAKILHDVECFNAQIDNLRDKSPFYPEVFLEEKGNVVWATTMVKFVYNGVEYKRHHVESIVITPTSPIEKLINMIKNNAELCIEYAIPYQKDEIIRVLK